MSNSEKGAWAQLWSTFFGKSWPMWVGGALLGTLNVLLFLVKSPWGGSGSYINWGENIYTTLGIVHVPGVKAVTANLYGLLGLMTVLGAFCGALLSRQFALRIPPPGEMFKGLKAWLCPTHHIKPKSPVTCGGLSSMEFLRRSATKMFHA